MKAKNLILTKAKVSYLYDDTIVLDALKTMRKVGYTMIPVINKETKKYLYSISNADIIAKVMDEKNVKCFKKPISCIQQSRFIAPSPIDVEIDDLIDLLANQSYVPMIDENGVFKGIITRKSLIYYLSSEKTK